MIVKKAIGICITGEKWFKEFRANNPAEKQIDVQVTHNGITKNFSYKKLVKLLGFDDN